MKHLVCWGAAFPATSQQSVQAGSSFGNSVQSTATTMTTDADPYSGHIIDQEPPCNTISGTWPEVFRNPLLVDSGTFSGTIAGTHFVATFQSPKDAPCTNVVTGTLTELAFNAAYVASPACVENRPQPTFDARIRGLGKLLRHDRHGSSVANRLDVCRRYSLTAQPARPRRDFRLQYTDGRVF